MTLKHILFSVGIALLCGLLKWIAETRWHNAQRFIIPVLVGAAIFLDFHYRLCAFTPLLAIGVIVLGYKVYGSSDFWDRFLWLMDAEVFLWLGCVVLKHLDWRIYLVAIGICGVWGGISRKWNNNWVAPISGILWGITYSFLY